MLYELDLKYPRVIARVLYLEREFRHTVFSNFLRIFYYQPMFRSKCKRIGKNPRIWGGFPYFSGSMEIFIGNNFQMHGMSNLEARTDVFDWIPKLEIGNDVSLGHRNVISVGRYVRIGNRVLTAPEVRIRDNDGHQIDPKKRFEKEPIESDVIKPVTIEDDVWIGAYCLINKGVTIGSASVIGSGSVVTNNIPPFCIAAGNPAQVIREIKSGKTSSKL